MRLWFVGFLAPALVSLVAFRIVPTVWVFKQSTEDQLGNPVGLENYRFLFNFPFFAEVVQTTLTFVLVVVAIQIALALCLAILFTQRVPLARFWRAVVFVPIGIPIAASTVVWGAALRENGLVNAVLDIAGIPAQPWLSSPSQALFSLMIIASWVGVGYWMTFLIAGLGEIPSSLYEAAMIDGAGWFQLVRRITLPMLTRPILFVIVADTVLAAVLFAPIAILTRGGPSRATHVLMYEVYDRAFISRDIPLAAVASVVLLTIVALLVTVQFLLLKSGSEQR